MTVEVLPPLARRRAQRLGLIWEERPGLLGWLTTVDHKRIGLLYFFTTLVFFGAGGIEALLIRTQLAGPNGTVLSPEAFNRVTKVPVVLPITSGGAFARTAGFAVSLVGAGTKTIGIVRCDQPRALDLAARGGKRLESIPDAIMDEVLARFAPIFE